MDLDQLRALIAVVESGSYTAASKLLPTSRVTLRARVEALEAEIGAPLLVRSHQGVEPTDAGRWLLKRGRRLVQEADELVQGARSMREEVSGELCILLPVGLPPDVVGALARLLREQHPELRLRVVYGNAPEAAQRYDPDFIVQLGPPWTDGRYRTSIVDHTRLALLGDRRFLDRAGRPGHPEDLKRFPILAWEMPTLDPEAIPLVNGQTLEVQPWFISQSAHLLRAMVCQGAGLALLPQSPATEGVPGEDLEVVLPNWIDTSYEMRMLVPESRAGSARCKAVIEMIRVLATQLPHMRGQ